VVIAGLIYMSKMSGWQHCSVVRISGLWLVDFRWSTPDLWL